MALDSGARLGPYEIVAPVGAGGMGEVYRARDTRLGRMVAIKVIGPAYGSHLETQRRFEAEARLAAQLDHPRIGAVFDVGHEDGLDYFVMEFIEGKTLADRIAQGPLPFAEMIGYGIEIAAGIAYAHSRGVEHHDLKPGNVMLTSSGVKIIDFGLAKLRHTERRLSEVMAAVKTMPLPPVEPGSVPGTPAYLPPERLQGQPADHRSDIFAFGLVLYEMAARRRAFDGPTPADLVAAILTAEPPPLSGLEPGLADVDWVIRKCLRKAPDERWQSMADVAAVLKRIAATNSKARPGEPPTAVSKLPRRLAAATIVVAVAGLALVANRAPTPATAPQRAVAFTIPPPPASGFTPTESSVQSPQLAVSPDGRYLAFVATGVDGVSQIWLRAIDSSIGRPLSGTMDATFPFWSASSRSIGFFSDGELKRINIDGGPSRSLAPARAGKGGAWSADDTILFSRDTNGGLYRITADGGVRQQTELSITRRETSHRWPQFLPDGRHFIYFAKSADDSQSGIRLASLDGHGDAVVVPTKFGAIYAPPGHVLYVSQDALLAASFEVASGRLMDDAVTVVDRIATSSNFYGAFSASNNGVLAFATSVSPAELAWIGRDGRRLSVAAGSGQYVDFQLSRDNRYLAIAEVEPHSDRSDLRLVDLVRGGNLRLTTSAATDASPVWSPDSTRLVFRSNRERDHDLYLRQAVGGGADAIFVKSPVSKYPTDWSPDGTFVVYHSFDERTQNDLWAAPVSHPDQSRTLLQTEFDEVQAQISPSGRWLAYTSNHSSRFEVYVQPLPADGKKWQVSIDGGSDPKWRADEKEIFYLDTEGRMMSVGLTGSASFDPGVPRPLFRLGEIAVIPPYLSAYNVWRDGQRFLVRASTEELQTHPLNVLVHWTLPARNGNPFTRMRVGSPDAPRSWWPRFAPSDAPQNR
jgi:serine/threonine protein kinase